jgi:hypothetical protein
MVGSLPTRLFTQSSWTYMVMCASLLRFSNVRRHFL